MGKRKSKNGTQAMNINFLLTFLGLKLFLGRSFFLWPECILTQMLHHSKIDIAAGRNPLFFFFYINSVALILRLNDLNLYWVISVSGLLVPLLALESLRTIIVGLTSFTLGGD